MMKKKILLIDPPMQSIMGFSKAGVPFGLLSLAGQIKKEGYDVAVLDTDYNPDGTPYPFEEKADHYHDYLEALENGHDVWDSIAGQIEAESPDVVGISVISPKLRSGLRVAQIAKELGIERVIFGGPHATIRPDDIISNPYVDSVVMGEGEMVFERALKTNGKITSKRIADLNSLPWPARDALVGIENYRKRDLGYLMSSRGCPSACNFCGSNKLWGHRVRMRDVGDVANEMDHLNSTYGVNEFYFLDDTFTMSKKRVNEFCDTIMDKNYDWRCLTRVDRMDAAMLEKMAASGCSTIKVGVESGSQRVLNLMKKGTTLDQVRNTAKLLNNQGMPWIAYIMVGVPGETVEDVNMTMDFINEIKPTYVGAAAYASYPGTGFAEQERKDNGENIVYSWEKISHDNTDRDVGDIPHGKVVEFMKTVDNYNTTSREAQKIIGKN